MKTLIEAIESSDVGTVWRLVQDGAELDRIETSTELTALALAAEAGHAEIVRILLGAGADPNQGGATSPLEAAVVEGHVEVAEALIEASVDVNQKVEEGFTPLMTAAATGSLRLVQILLDAGARPRVTNDDGDSAVTLAEEAGHEPVVKALKSWRRKKKPEPAPTEEEAASGAVETAPEPSAPEPSVPEPSAPEPSVPEPSAPEPSVPEPSVPEPSAQEEGAGAVLGQEEDAEAESLFAETSEDAFSSQSPFEPETVAFDEAAASEAPEESPEAVEAVQLEEATDFDTDLGVFAEGIARLRELIEQGAEQEIRDYLASGALPESDALGRTALMAAAHLGELELVRVLIEAGADVDAYENTKSGQSALVHAVKCESPERLEIVSMLADAGANLNQRCGLNLRTALMYAAEADVYLDRDPGDSFARTTKSLIRLGAELEVKDRRGRTLWRLIKRDAIGAPTFSSCRRRLHHMLRILEYSGAQPIASHEM